MGHAELAHVVSTAQDFCSSAAELPYRQGSQTHVPSFVWALQSCVLVAAQGMHDCVARPCSILALSSRCDGVICRGLRVSKTSRRDLALVMAKGLDGATTVSATMLLAARAGIHVFVTGGGGPHTTLSRLSEAGHIRRQYPPRQDVLIEKSQSLWSAQ